MFSAQALYYWPHEFRLWVPYGFKLKVFNLDKRTPVNYEPWGFEDFEYLLEHLELEALNIVYMPLEMWKEFISKLHKLWNRDAWLTIIFDEVEELCPPYAQGQDWRINESIAEAIKEYRKCWISFYCATQQPSDVDYRLRNKMMFRIYLKGAKKMSFERFRQELIDNLKLGEAVVAGARRSWEGGCGEIGLAPTALRAERLLAFSSLPARPLSPSSLRLDSPLQPQY